jgi:hypothetical protein
MKRYRRSIVTGVATVALAVGMFAGLGPGPSSASSHREAPLVSADPQIDETDLYAFVSPDNPRTVTILSNWIPFEEPAGGPNFYAWAEGVHYDVNIDNDGDSFPDLIYRWDFTSHYRNTDTFLYNTGVVTTLNDPDLNFYQTYDLTRIDVDANKQKLVANDVISVPSDVGDASMPNYGSLVSQGVYRYTSQDSTFAGQGDDPFFLDLRVFDLLYGANFGEAGDDTLAGFNVNVLGLQVRKNDLAKNGNAGANPIVGIWTTASRQSVRVENPDGTIDSSGDFIQVSRLGMPLVNEVVVPVGSKDLFNHTPPNQDGQFLPKVNDPELPHLINAIYGIPVPDSNPGMAGIQRDDLIAVFLTGVAGLNQPPGVTPSEQMRLNMSIPPCEKGSCPDYSPLGVIGGDLAGYPNGRRLADDTIDISLQVVEGELIGSPNDLADGVDANDVPFMAHFPYLALSHSGSDPMPHGLTQ